MILLLDTSTPVCRLTFVDGDAHYDTEWEANRELGRGLLGYIESELQKQSKTFEDVSGIGVFKGPGSFTGLRIGLTVANTLADALPVPIIGETGEAWQEAVIKRLENGENERIVLPLYGGDAHITKPRK